MERQARISSFQNVLQKNPYFLWIFTQVWTFSWRNNWALRVMSFTSIPLRWDWKGFLRDVTNSRQKLEAHPSLPGAQVCQASSKKKKIKFLNGFIWNHVCENFENQKVLKNLKIPSFNKKITTQWNCIYICIFKYHWFQVYNSFLPSFFGQGFEGKHI